MLGNVQTAVYPRADRILISLSLLLGTTRKDASSMKVPRGGVPREVASERDLRQRKSGQSVLESSATSNIPSAGDFTPQTCAVSPPSRFFPPPRRRSGDPTGQLFNRQQGGGFRAERKSLRWPRVNTSTAVIRPSPSLPAPTLSRLSARRGRGVFDVPLARISAMARARVRVETFGKASFRQIGKSPLASGRKTRRIRNPARFRNISTRLKFTLETNLPR